MRTNRTRIVLSDLSLMCACQCLHVSVWMRACAMCVFCRLNSACLELIHTHWNTLHECTHTHTRTHTHNRAHTLHYGRAYIINVRSDYGEYSPVHTLTHRHTHTRTHRHTHTRTHKDRAHTSHYGQILSRAHTHTHTHIHTGGLTAIPLNGDLIKKN